MNRSALGVFSLVLFVVGAFQMATAPGDGSLGGVFVRASLVLGAVWLVLPNARRLPRAVWAGIAAFAAVLILVPRLVSLGRGARSGHLRRGISDDAADDGRAAPVTS